VTAVRVENPTRGTTLGIHVAVAESWWSRLRGLLNRPPLIRGEGLLLRPCKAIHMRGMRYGIDVAFVDRNDRVIALYHNLMPGRRTRWHWRAAAALELPAGTLHSAGTREGDVLTWTTVPGRKP
jgi:uncharacterized membrane protein (UPF0127 family)